MVESSAPGPPVERGSTRDLILKDRLFGPLVALFLSSGIQSGASGDLTETRRSPVST